MTDSPTGRRPALEASALPQGRRARARVRAVLIDAAGTLIRPREPIGESYARAARAHGVSVSPWRIEDAFRRVLAKAPPMAFPGAAPEQVPALERDWWREVVRRSFLAAEQASRPHDFDALFDSLWEHFADPRAWAPAPGAHGALAALREAGVAVAVVSNFDTRLPGILEGLRLSPWIDAVVLPSRARACKPDPAIFHAALEALRCAAGDAVVVGDDPDADVAAARALGMRAIDVGGLATLDELPARVLEGSP